MPVILTAAAAAGCRGSAASVRVSGNGFPSFLPKEVERIRDPHLRELAKRMQRIPVKLVAGMSPCCCCGFMEQHGMMDRCSNDGCYSVPLD